MRIPGVAATLLPLALVAAGGCNSKTETRAASAERGAMAGVRDEAPPTLAAPAPKIAAEAARSDEAKPPEIPDQGAPGELPADPAMIVRSGNASVEVDSLKSAVSLLRRLTDRVGGFIGNTAVQTGRDQTPQATLQLRVPAARFDELASGLASLGKVEFVNVSAEDVGEEFVDLTARAANARRLEARLLDILGTRTGRLRDVLELERELARVREEIERMEGRLRFLRSRATVSTLSVTLHEPLPILADHPGGGVLAEAFRQAWRNCVGVVAALVAGAGALAPVAALVAAAIFLVRRYRRRALPPTPSP